MTALDACDAVLADIRACTLCADALPRAPRPILQAGATARIGIFGQAPGNLAHERGRPFADPSGVRLRAWLGVDEAVFYNRTRIAVAPMGFCFPGTAERGGDLPPRPECAPAWRDRLLATMPNLRLEILVGSYAVKWRLGVRARRTLTETVAHWRDYGGRVFPLPHPSWRNNAWLARNPWFEATCLPALRAAVAAALSDSPSSDG
ncbi:MAG: uracil-DNA glycosylase family protein [Pseudomonadota bacterium]